MPPLPRLSWPLLLLLGVSSGALAQPSLNGAHPFGTKTAMHCAPRYTQAELNAALNQAKCSEGVTNAYSLTDIPETMAQAQSSVTQALSKGGFTVSPAFHAGSHRTILMVTIPNWTKQIAPYPAAALLNPVRVLLLPAGPKLTSVFFESVAAQLVHTPIYSTGLKLDQKLETALRNIKGSQYSQPMVRAPGTPSSKAHPKTP